MTVKDYLKHAMQLEATIYEQSKVVTHTKHILHNLENPEYAETRRKIRPWDDYCSFGEFLLSLIGVPLFCTFIGGCLGILVYFCAVIGQVDVTYPRDFTKFIVIFAVIGFIASIIFFAIDERRRHSINADIDADNQQAIQYNASLQKHNPEKAAKLKAQLTKAQQNLSQSRSLLSKLYAQGVLHPKYRNFVAVSMMYEYFDTGRCSALQGHGGAYDTYEYELRQNIIIGKLDVIIDKLDQIADSQYALYQAIKECNRNVARVNRGLDTLQKTNNRILECAEVSAYNSRITASNTTMMRTLMVYDHL